VDGLRSDSDWRLGAAMPGLPMRGFLAAAVGFFSALMGIGGGTFGVPLMTLSACRSTARWPRPRASAC
jgi:uncharacterized membrane protein YfcA